MQNLFGEYTSSKQKMSDSVNIVVQSGGNLIGKGMYGCIFNPPLVCHGAKKPRLGWHSKKLGKITQLMDIKSEIDAAKLLGSFPESKKYFILPEIKTLCKPAPMATQTEKDLNDCTPLVKYGSKDMMQYELVYAGKPVKARIDAADISVGVFPFFQFMGQLLEIGAFLVLHGCIHNDIHGNNILLDDDSHTRLIDFGRTYIYSNINTQTVEDLSEVEYNPELGQVPPELTAHHGIKEGRPIHTIINDLYKSKPALLYGERILGISRKQQMDEFRQFWKTSRAIETDDWTSFYKLYWPVVDSWAIGHVLLGILKRLLLSKKFTESKDWIAKQGIVKEVLKGLIQASPRRRIDAVQALSIYDPMNDVLSDPSGRAWLEARQR